MGVTELFDSPYIPKRYNGLRHRFTIFLALRS